MEQPGILSLSKPVSNRLRSSVIIPTLPQALSELVQNSLDAGSSRIECWIRLIPGDEFIRVQDDGFGIDEESMKKLGERYSQSFPLGHIVVRVDQVASSKSRTEHQLTPVTSFGFRGEGVFWGKKI